MKDKRPLKVLQVVASLGMGGAETWLMEVLRLWSKTGAAQLNFLVTSGNRGIFDEEARQLGAQIHYVRYSRVHLKKFVGEFRKILQDGQYDAIHDHSDHASGWHFLMGAGVLPPVRVTHVHNPIYQIRNNYGVTVARRLTARLGKALVGRYATHIMGTSRQLIGEYAFDDVRFRNILKGALHCGFDPARFIGDPAVARASVCQEFTWPEDTPIVLFAGRLDASLDFCHPRNHKNSAFAVAVFGACLQREPRTKMIMAGANEHVRESFLRHLAEQGLDKAVVLAGVRRDIERLMLGSRVLLFPSRAEGLGMVAVEAQASGLSVIASNTVPEECVVLPDLVSFEDISAPVERWADALVRNLQQPRRNPRVSDPRWSESNFNIRASAARLEELYRTGAVCIQRLQCPPNA